MTVSSFDPTATQPPLDAATIQALLGCDTAGDQVHLSADEAAALAGVAAHPGWGSAAEDLADDEIRHLVRVFTLGEMAFAGWQAGDKSPVIQLVRVLKTRGVFEQDFGRWIKAHTSNRFLPHGSLMDRL